MYYISKLQFPIVVVVVVGKTLEDVTSNKSFCVIEYATTTTTTTKSQV